MPSSGPPSYTVVAYEPGRRIAFEFEHGSGLRGHHRLEVEPVGTGRARMRHVLDAEANGIDRVLRPVFLAMHDALVEDLLDKAELATTGRLARAARWPRGCGSRTGPRSRCDLAEEGSRPLRFQEP